MLNSNQKVAVIGAGSWGTAIVSILSLNTDLMWWARRPGQIDQISTRKRNIRYLPNCKLNIPNITFSSNIEKTIDYADLIIVATPSEYLSDLFSPHKELLSKKILISAVKGVITNLNLTPFKFFKGLNPSLSYGVISGPCHAEEVALLKMSYLTLSVQDKTISRFLEKIFSSNFINIKHSHDIIGTELSAILKNVYALVTGICHGLGYGDNFLAVLITACANELKRVLYVLDKKERSISQPAYLGDLLVTCYSLHSRNRRFGAYIGKGFTVEATKDAMNMVAEGYNATACVHDLLQNSSFVESAPIIHSCYKILYQDVDPQSEIEQLSTLIS
jgi:glycerol-3-phosphate dehydrogenase (NAD(P)+)